MDGRILKTKASVYSKKNILPSIKYLLAGFAAGIVLHAIAVFLTGNGEKWFSSHYSNLNASLVFQINKILEAPNWFKFPLVLILVFLILKIPRLAKTVVFCWLFFSGIILWLSLLGFAPSDPQIFLFNPNISPNIFLMRPNFNTLFNYVTLTAIALLAWELFKIIWRWSKRSIKVEDPTLRNFYSLIVKKSKKVKNFLIPEKDKLVYPSDNPVENLQEIIAIRKVVGNNSLFQNFEENVNALYSIISNKTNGLIPAQIICIDGSWGSGKTSLVKILKEKIEDNANPKNQDIHWIDFDPWNFNNSDELIQQFFKKLNAELRESYGENLEPDLTKYANLITPAFETAGLPKSLGAVFDFLSIFGKKNLEELRESIEKKLQSIAGLIVILVDDVDRLEYDELNLLLKLVRQNSSFSNLAFILPFDYSRISNLIISERNNRQEYRNFLQKIITTRFTLDKYSDEELLGIFSATIRNFKKDASLETLKKDYDFYVMRRLKNLFIEIRKDELSSELQDVTLRPLFSFYQEVFNEFIKDRSYQKSYGGIREIILSFVSEFADGEYETFDELLHRIYRPIQQILRPEKISGIQAKISQLCSEIGIGDPDRDALNNTLASSFNDFSPYGEDRVSVFNSHLEQFKTSHENAIKNNAAGNFDKLNTVFNEVLNDAKAYANEYEINFTPEKITFVRNWVVKNYTAREVKQVAIHMQSLKKDEWNDDKRREAVIAKVADQQV